MGYWALEHPNLNARENRDGHYWGRHARRDVFSGSIVVHSAEVPPDYVGEDWGAENTARYFEDSTRPASYHRIADSDSIVRFLPFTHEAFHDGTGGNRWSVGVSMGTQAHTWGTRPDHDEKMLRNGAAAAAEAATYWASLHSGRDPMRCARWITAEEYRRKEPGLIEHGHIDPGRRSDPWTVHRLRPELRERFVTYMREALGSPTEDNMNAGQERKLDDVAAAVTAVAARLEQLETKVDLLRLLPAVHRHLAGSQGDDRTTLRSRVEMIWNRHYSADGRPR